MLLILNKKIKTYKPKLCFGMIVVSHVDILHILFNVFLHESVLFFYYSAVELNESIGYCNLNQIMVIYGWLISPEPTQDIKNIRSYFAVNFTFHVDVIILV